MPVISLTHLKGPVASPSVSVMVAPFTNFTSNVLVVSATQSEQTLDEWDPFLSFPSFAVISRPCQTDLVSRLSSSGCSLVRPTTLVIVSHVSCRSLKLQSRSSWWPICFSQNLVPILTCIHLLSSFPPFPHVDSLRLPPSPSATMSDDEQHNQVFEQVCSLISLRSSSLLIVPDVEC